VNKVKEFEKDFLEFLQQTQSNSRCFEAGKLTDEIGCNQTVAKEISAKYN
jgi:hypothetical protein